MLGYAAYAAIDIFNNNMNANISIDNAPATDLERLAADPGMKRNGIELAKLEQASKLNEQEAIARAKGILGTAFGADKATSVKAVYALLTDKDTPKLPESNTELNNLPVWVVTFEGLEIRPHGPRPKNGEQVPERIKTQLHVMVDANTGEELEMLSFR